MGTLKIARNELQISEEGYIDFTDLVWNVLGLRCDDVFLYLKGLASRPNLGEGLDYIAESGWHEAEICSTDAMKFVRRLTHHRMNGLHSKEWIDGALQSYAESNESVSFSTYVESKTK